MAFNLAQTELGTGNFDLQSEVYYVIRPTVVNPPAGTISLATGATGLPILPTASPTPTPSVTPTPTPMPTATPTPSPTPTPGATPSPTPVTPAAVLGLSPGMLAHLNSTSALDPPIVPRTAVGSIRRSFLLPIQL